VSNNWNATSSIMAEAGVVFTRIRFGMSGSCKLHNGTGDSGVNASMKSPDNLSTLTGGPGKYIVFKVRVGGTSIGDLKIGAWDGSGRTDVGNGDPIYDRGNSVRVVTEEMVEAGWNIYIIETRALNTDYYDPSYDPDLELASFGLKIRNGRGGTGTDYVDVACFAIVDDWDGVMNIIKNENLEKVKVVSKWSDAASDVYRSIDGTCLNGGHTPIVKQENAVSPDTLDANVCFTCDENTYCSNPLCEFYSTPMSSIPGKVVSHVIVSTEGAKTYKDGTDEAVCYTYVATNTCSHCNKEISKTNENGAHVLGAPVVSDNTITYKCSACKITHTITVPDSINYYSAPGQVVNNWGTANVYATGGVCGAGSAGVNYKGNKALLTDIVADENGIYTRVHCYQGASVFLANGTITASGHDEKMAQDILADGQDIGNYMVVRVRSINNDYIRFGFFADNGARLAWEGNARVAADISAGQFVTYVIDISALKNAEDPAKKVTVLMGANTSIGRPGERLDIAYFAMCDNWDEIKAVVGEDQTVLVTGWKTTEGDKLCKSDGTEIN